MCQFQCHTLIPVLLYCYLASNLGLTYHLPIADFHEIHYSILIKLYYNYYHPLDSPFRECN